MKLVDRTAHSLGLKSLFAALILSTGVTVALVGTANAQASVKDMQGAERIDLSVRAHALSQKIGVSSCFIQGGIDADKFKTISQTATDEFGKIILALENGDPAYNVGGAEKVRKVQVGIGGASYQMDMFRPATKGLMAGPATERGFNYLALQNQNLTRSTEYLTAEVINAYTNPPELLQSDALTLYIAGRQRALAMQIGMETCGVTSSQRLMGDPLHLEKTIKRFDASLNALRNGFEGAGVTKPPTDAIAASLVDIAADWDALKPQLLAVSGPSSVDGPGLVNIFTQLDAISVKFDDLTLQYVKASKSGL